MSNSESSRQEKRPQAAVGPCVLLYDGSCGLCQRTVRWMLRHDADARLLFAPLHHPVAAQVFSRHALDPRQIDSVVLVLNFGGPEECVALRSDAILGCLGLLGGGWALLAGVARIVPRALRDLGYNGIARNRRRLFPSDQTCTLPTPAERLRFFND